MQCHAMQLSSMCVNMFHIVHHLGHPVPSFQCRWVRPTFHFFKGPGCLERQQPDAAMVHMSVEKHL